VFTFSTCYVWLELEEGHPSYPGGGVEKVFCSYRICGDV
jgi:hypothetical protein